MLEPCLLQPCFDVAGKEAGGWLLESGSRFELLGKTKMQVLNGFQKQGSSTIVEEL